MAKLKLVKQLEVVVKNKVGMLAEVSSEIAKAGVNIQAINAYAIDNQAYFRILTEDNQKAKQALLAKGYAIKEQDVVQVELPNRVGALKEAAQTLKAAGIDLQYIFGSTCSCGGDSILVFASNNNAQAKAALLANLAKQ